MQKDYGPSIRAGFEATGIYPTSVDRALSKLPAENREVTSEVHQVCLKVSVKNKKHFSKTLEKLLKKVAEPHHTVRLWFLL
jgi:hypothetical protein